jgi:peptidoglycan L-alanyl-D-glutamate endopeptidase CwlK
MASVWRGLPMAMLLVGSLGIAPEGFAKDAFAAASSAAPDVPHRLSGPDDVYANIPPRDDRGRDQIAMFREWNPDPKGNHEANLRAISPSLARVIRKAQADNPGLSFVIGSGRRDRALQGKAFAWGWSRTRSSQHETGEAVDLWPLDAIGRVTFDAATQGRIGAAMKKAAADLGVPIRWGGHFRSFKERDRSHFELAPRLAGAAPAALPDVGCPSGTHACATLSRQTGIGIRDEPSRRLR